MLSYDFTTREYTDHGTLIRRLLRTCWALRKENRSFHKKNPDEYKDTKYTDAYKEFLTEGGKGGIILEVNWVKLSFITPSPSQPSIYATGTTHEAYASFASLLGGIAKSVFAKRVKYEFIF